MPGQSRSAGRERARGPESRERTAAFPLVEGQLHRLGGVAEVDGRLSWFSASREGFAPINCYLLTAERTALLVDTGVAAHKGVVLSQLGELLPEEMILSIVHTRIAEFDSLGNTSVILNAFPVATAYAHFPAQDWVHIHPADDTALSAPEAWATVLPGRTVIELDGHRGGPRRVDCVAAPLRVLLPTTWAYDEATRTLFTSDSFGHVLLDRADSPPVVTEDDDTTTLDLVLQHLLVKFDWLAGASTAVIRRDLEELFDRYDVDRIAPGHGCVLFGRDLVKRHVDFVLSALAELETQPSQLLASS